MRKYISKYTVWAESPCVERTGDPRDIYVVATDYAYTHHGKGGGICITGSLSAAREIAEDANKRALVGCEIIDTYPEGWIVDYDESLDESK